MLVARVLCVGMGSVLTRNEVAPCSCCAATVGDVRDSPNCLPCVDSGARSHRCVFPDNWVLLYVCTRSAYAGLTPRCV